MVRNQIILGVLGALALIVSVIAALRVAAAINKPLDKITDTMNKVNAGDLAARSGVRTGDELGVLSQSLDNMLDDKIATMGAAAKENESLNNSVISLLQAVFQLGNRDLTARAPVTEDVVGTVSSSVNQFADETAKTLGEVQALASQVRAVSNVVTQQAEIVQRSAAAEQRSVEAMVQNLSQASDQLIQVSGLSDKSGQAAERAAGATQAALTAVEGTIIGMENVRETIGEVEKRFKRLGERTQEISNAVGLVKIGRAHV